MAIRGKRRDEAHLTIRIFDRLSGPLDKGDATYLVLMQTAAAKVADSIAQGFCGGTIDFEDGKHKGAWEIDFDAKEPRP